MEEGGDCKRPTTCKVDNKCLWQRSNLHVYKQTKRTVESDLLSCNGTRTRDARR